MVRGIIRVGEEELGEIEWKKKFFNNQPLLWMIFVISAVLMFSIFLYSQMNWANLPLVQLEKTPWELFNKICIVTGLISVISGIQLSRTLSIGLEKKEEKLVQKLIRASISAIVVVLMLSYVVIVVEAW